MSDYDYSYGEAEPEPVRGIFNHPCLLPVNGSLALINGSFHVLDEMSCADTPLFLLCLGLTLCAVLAFMRNAGSAAKAPMI
mmetsp:Transcript_41684/g.56648  ORF Transcript_41684/g.56648 Transcript_41684/m.56648 type:complete len:81 (-) Transcript_41684:772-1014(-)|eukprot:scaffold269996_cov35-Tisochrysis_lutea.AAC.3